MKINTFNKGFTLIEILVGILIFSIVIIGGFKAFSSITIGKIRLIQKTNIEKSSIYFTQKLFELIKKGGTIDYEEYFNRKVVGTTYLSGHYQKETGFGNFGSGGIVGSNTFGDNFYYCRSGVGASMGTGGCFNSSFNNYGSSPNTKPQRYGEYSFQFIDYNSNMNSDNGNPGDEDGDGNIIGDDDDEYLGVGPSIFIGNTTKEIYLISGDKKIRTILRWNVIQDPNTPAGIICTFGNGSNPSGSGCLGNIQFLKLEGKDWGFNHNKSPGPGTYDGVIDTWLIHSDFVGVGNQIVGGTSYEKYWQDLFPKDINVTNFGVEIYPNKDVKLSWKEKIKVSPYLRIHFNITPSWRTKRKMKGSFPELKFSTTINLTGIYSK